MPYVSGIYPLTGESYRRGRTMVYDGVQRFQWPSEATKCTLMQDELHHAPEFYHDSP